MEPRVHKALVAAIFCVVRPLARLLVRYGISFGVLAAVGKQTYVAMAFEDFGLPGRQQTTSRVAILTGVSHKEVARLRRRPHVFWGPRQAVQW